MVLCSPPSRTLFSHHFLVALQEENGDIRLVRNVETREAGAQHGLARALLNNMVVGVSTGFTRTLMLVGVGYRAAVSGTKLTLNLGYSKPVELAIPGGVEVGMYGSALLCTHATGAGRGGCPSPIPTASAGRCLW